MRILWKYLQPYRGWVFLALGLAALAQVLALYDPVIFGKVIEPGDNSLKAKEVPIEVFFHKIVMLRDRLRVMEQQINAHKVLTDEEKINLQQYVTRIYGTLTTFNVLFRNKEDWFIGDKSSE